MQGSSVQNFKNHSPSEFEGREKLVYITKNLDGYLSLSELREALVALAQNHYLSYQYIMNNFGANDHDALQEVFDGESNGIFQKANPNESTSKLFWHLRQGLTERDIQNYIYPKIAKHQKPKIQDYSEIVRPVKRFSPKTKKSSYNPNPRGESNRIATARKSKHYESLTGDKTPDRKPSPENYHWSDTTSRQLGRALRSGKIQPDND